MTILVLNQLSLKRITKKWLNRVLTQEKLTYNGVVTPNQELIATSRCTAVSTLAERIDSSCNSQVQGNVKYP